MKKCNLLLMITLFVVLSFTPIRCEAKEKLTKREQVKAEQMYKKCKKNWKKYGVLPSVCIVQAKIESGMGSACRSNNWWGLGGGRYSYASFDKGINAYFKCINNGYYKGAKGQKKYYVQLKKIVNGGYCGSPNHYYKVATSEIRKYGLNKYDKRMFKELRKEKRERLIKYCVEILTNEDMPITERITCLMQGAETE